MLCPHENNFSLFSFTFYTMSQFFGSGIVPLRYELKEKSAKISLISQTLWLVALSSQWTITTSSRLTQKGLRVKVTVPERTQLVPPAAANICLQRLLTSFYIEPAKPLFRNLCVASSVCGKYSVMRIVICISSANTCTSLKM